MQTASKYLMKKRSPPPHFLFFFFCMPLSFKTEMKRKCMVHNVFRFLVLKLDEVILPHSTFRAWICTEEQWMKTNEWTVDAADGESSKAERSCAFIGLLFDQ